MTKIQWVTLGALLLYIAHELFYIPWFGANTQGAVIRLDLLYIYPVLLILIAISIWQYLRRR